MPAIHNPNRTLRFSLELADIAAQDRAFICTAAVEYLDKRDQEFWPTLRLPVLRVPAEDAHALTQALRDVCSQARPGFCFRTGAREELQLALSRQGGAVAVEVGVDLCVYLLETAGVPSPPGRELALFRFEAPLAEVVVFADAVAARVAELEGRVRR